MVGYTYPFKVEEKFKYGMRIQDWYRIAVYRTSVYREESCCPTEMQLDVLFMDDGISREEKIAFLLEKVFGK